MEKERGKMKKKETDDSGDLIRQLSTIRRIQIGFVALCKVIFEKLVCRKKKRSV